MFSRCIRLKTHKKCCGRRCIGNGRTILKQANVDGVVPPPLDLVPPPKHARVVVCGGGVMGASVAYNLAKLGWGAETVLIEQNRLALSF